MTSPRIIAGKATIGLAGDVMLGRGVAESIQRSGPAHPWGNLLPRLWELDLFLVNLECALTCETREWGIKPFHFRADPTMVETLRLGRVDFAGVANNHIGDFGEEGLLETIRTLDRAGIAHAGAGPTLEAARVPARLHAKRWRISVLAVADYPAEWAAGPDRPGMNYLPISLDPRQVGEVETAVRMARQDADLVVVCIHWGPNMRPRPTAEFRAFARRISDAGADIFWGHSAHVVQGVEVREGRLILFDTGDFVDDYAVDASLRNDLSALFVVRLGVSGIEGLDLVPVRIGRCQVSLAEGRDRSWILERIAALSRELGTTLAPSEPGLSLSVGEAGSRQEVSP